MPSATPAPDNRQLLQENRERSAANRAALARRQSDARAITSAVNRDDSFSRFPGRRLGAGTR